MCSAAYGFLPADAAGDLVGFAFDGGLIVEVVELEAEFGAVPVDFGGGLLEEGVPVVEAPYVGGDFGSVFGFQGLVERFAASDHHTAQSLTVSSEDSLAGNLVGVE